MDSEIKSFITVWISAMTSLTYCYFISFIAPKGILRLLTILPVFILFTLLPLNLNTVILGGPTVFFLTWLANFKLLLLCFGRGPLISGDDSENPPLSLPCFISTACLPIQTINNNNKNKPIKKFPKSSLNLTIKTIIFLLLILLFEHIQHIVPLLPLHPSLILVYYCICIYVGLEVMLAFFAGVAATVHGLRLEPQFDEPYLATSLQDFWGRRWNLMVTKVMRPAVYFPVKRAVERRLIIGTKWAALLLAVVSTFVVSGLMHELIFYYLCRVRPTWEVTLFFVLQGVCLAGEIGVKSVLLERKVRVHRVVSGVMAIGFVMVSGFWLFFPQLLRCRVDTRMRDEIGVFVGSVQSLVRSVVGSDV